MQINQNKEGQKSNNNAHFLTKHLTYSDLCVDAECVMTEPLHEAWLANPRVSAEDDFKAPIGSP